MDHAASDAPANPLDPAEPLSVPSNGTVSGDALPLAQDSAVTRAEKVERNGVPSGDPDASTSSAKRKLADVEDVDRAVEPPRKKGEAPIKAEYLIDFPKPSADVSAADDRGRANGDRGADGDQKQGKRAKNRGQNTKRDFGSSKDKQSLCMTRAQSNEFSPKECRFGDACKFAHDLRHYLKDLKRDDLSTFGDQCPVFEARGTCHAGWKCRFVHTHSEERTHPDGRKELVLKEEPLRSPATTADDAEDEDANIGVINNVPMSKKIELRRKKYSTEKSDKMAQWLNSISAAGQSGMLAKGARHEEAGDDGADGEEADAAAAKQDSIAAYREPPFRPSEKRRIYYGPETPVLAPLTTQGNLPFRRLCVSLGAQLTWSEMAMGMPLVQGEKAEWALLRAHESERGAPAFSPSSSRAGLVSAAYDNTHDLKFGAQLAANKPWVALKATEVVTALCPHLRAVDLNCGCPIDLVYRQGAGSALLDSPARLEKILRGMNTVSGEVPVTVKIRMGTKDNQPTADKLINRLAFGGQESQDIGLGPCGVAAVTLHGRSRQQRYTRSADWSYIAHCAALVKRYNDDRAALADTVREPDARDLANTRHEGLYFVGNGDCYSHTDYGAHIASAGVDSVMAARGALIKPWLFEEIAAGQHLDKSASERLAYVEQFAKFGLQYWGSDEMGVGTTRRFLLEWLSFACRYVPVGLLEVLPPNLQDRPPAYRGRSELETLLSSDNYKDWIKISEMFLGKANDGFRFEPKHKSNAYEETEG